MKILNFYTDASVGVGLLGNSSGPGAEILALGLYLLLAAYMFWDARRGGVEG